MISGSELNNSFNVIIRARLININDNSGFPPGRAGYLIIGKKKYYLNNIITFVDLYIEMCEDILDEYYRKKEIKLHLINSFLNEFKTITIHFLGNGIKNSTRTKSKELVNEYLDEIKSYYKEEKVIEKIEKIKKEVKEFKIQNIFQNKPKPIKEEFSDKKKPKNKTHENKPRKTPPSETITIKENSILQTITKIIFMIFIISIFFSFILYLNYYQNNNLNSTIENKSIINTTIKNNTLEKPRAPIIEKFKLTELEKNVLSKINQKRIKYRKTRLQLNLNLSELGKDYLNSYLENGIDIAKSKIGTIMTRKEKINLTQDIIEYRYKYQINNSNVANSIINNIIYSKLYDENYNNIGLAIIKKENIYHILIDLY